MPPLYREQRRFCTIFHEVISEEKTGFKMNINSLVLRSIGFEPMTFRLGRDSSIRAELRARIMPIIYNNGMEFNRYWRCNLARGYFPYSPHPRPLSPANFVRTARGAIWERRFHPLPEFGDGGWGLLRNPFPETLSGRRESIRRIFKASTTCTTPLRELSNFKIAFSAYLKIHTSVSTANSRVG
jgi:hypothetical protein